MYSKCMRLNNIYIGSLLICKKKFGNVNLFFRCKLSLMIDYFVKMYNVSNDLYLLT